MNFLCLIPARGGSKRIPRKNLKNLNGHPLIYYTIKFASSIQIFNKIAVSSEDPEILSYCSVIGIETIERPASLSQDVSSTGVVVKHAVTQYEQNNERIDSVVTLQPTNPFRSIDDFNNAIEKFKKNKPKCLLSIAKLNHKFGIIRNNTLVPYNYSYGDRSQDMESFYYETGQFYFTSRETALMGKVLTEEASTFECSNWFDHIDIDDMNDFKLAEILMENRKSEFTYL